MTEERAKRKMSAIMSADVKGYSSLMGEDELRTVQMLKEDRQVIGKHVHEYHGRVVDSPGDNVLAEFDSVVDAVECAVEIQEELKAPEPQITNCPFCGMVFDETPAFCPQCGTIFKKR